MRRRLVLAAAVTFVAAGCGKSAPPPDQAGVGAGGAPATPPDQEPPVPLNPDSPIQYPPKLYDQKVEGDVVLRLFVDSSGRLLAESSKVAESSGYSALDSAALAGARQLRFAPARRRGLAVATAFLQPIEFRHPGGGAVKPKPAPRPPPALPPPPPASLQTRPAAQPPRVSPETSGVRRDSVVAPRDTSPVRQDTSGAKADSGAGPH